MKHLVGLLTVLGLFNSQAAEAVVRPALVYEKIFGGTGTDTGTSVAVDADGYVYVAGTTTSVDFPVKNGFQPRIGGIPLRISTNNGKTWVSPAIPAPVFAVAGSPKQIGVLFAGTATGIFKSTDAGNTWNSLKSGPGYQVNSVIVDPADPAVIYSGGSEGIFKSSDGGLTWRQNTLQGQSNVIVLVSNPLRSSTLFAGVNLGGIPGTQSLYRSTDAGITWTLLLNSPIGAFALACDPTNPDVVYAGVSKGGFISGATSTAVYKTPDAGSTWTKLADLPLAISTLNLVASPIAVYAATTKGVMRSRDGGITWNATSITDAADVVAVDPNNPQVVFASANGIFASTDGGTNWTSVLPVRQYVQSISVVPSTPSSVFVGASPGQNIFVSKWSKDGTQLLYSTYLGGSFADFSKGIAVDSQGNAYVTGYTFSTDFPVTATAVQSKNAGPYNAFLAKIGADGSTLAYSTYLGGSSGDAAEAIAVDRIGNAYLTGYTLSSDFPVTSAAQQKLRQGCSTAPSPGSMSRANLGDAFVMKISPVAAALSYSTYLGGTCADEGLGITVDPSGNAYVVGATTSPDFPVTKGALIESYGGSANTGFLAKLTPQGAIANATFLGGPGSDAASAVALGDDGSVYVTGSTAGFDQILFGVSGSYVIVALSSRDQLPVPGFPIGSSGAAYVLKLDSAASTQKYLKYIGGNSGNGTAIAVDGLGRAWVAGSTNSLNIFPYDLFPTVHPFQADTGTGFVTELSADGSVLPFSSLMDATSGLALDTSGNAFVIGNTYRFISYKYFFQSMLLDRIDAAVPSAITVEEPQRLIPKLGSNYPFFGVASSEIVMLSGTGLGPAQEVGAQLTQDGKVATSLAGISVTFDDVPAPLLSVQSERIVCIVPFEIADNQVRNPVMQVRSNSSRSNAILLATVESAVEVLAVANADGSPNTADHPAAPGSVLTVYAAGFGQTKPSSVDGQINGIGSLVVTVGVNIGEQDAQILYAGPAPGLVAGITQINFRLPQLPPATYTTYVGWGPRKTFGDYNATPVYVGQ